MRQLTDSEQVAIETAWKEYLAMSEGYSEFVPLRHGFISALAHTDAQIAALTAERDRLREAQFKAVKTLKRMVKGWRKESDGEYCQTYNRGMGQGLNGAAGMLEEYVNEAWRAKDDPT